MDTKQITYGIEDLVSRIPGLFPYLEFCENGMTVVHSAKDSENGCYGKIPCGIRLPEHVGLVYDGKEFLSEGGSYSYRTLMNIYYAYKDSLPDDDIFIMFMEKCIGRFKVDEGIAGQNCDLVPEYAYYGECARLYSEYSSMSRMCSAYLGMKSDLGDINCTMECLVEKYARMGGDAMMEYFRQKSIEAEQIADTLLDEIADVHAGSIYVNMNFVSSENDLGVLSTFLDYWVPNRPYSGGDIVIYNDRTYICTCPEGAVSKGLWDEDSETVVFDTDNFEMLTYSDNSHEADDTWDIVGTMPSGLETFKNSVTYIDEGGSVKTPGTGEDWLWYYRTGSVVNHESSTDEYGNINVTDGHERNLVVGDYDTNLMVYGDVMTGIECNEDDMTVTFTYVIGANLKARLTDIQTHDDGTARYCYGNYAYNDDGVHGVVCTETYPFSGDMSEIEEILGTDSFANYVSADRPVDYQYYKCAFDTDYSSEKVSITVNGVTVTKSVRMTNFTVPVGNDRDVLVSPVTKKDYLVGITMNPHVESNVFVNRGNAAAWERHVKLGEVKTMEQLKSYANGGFFNLI